MEYSKNFGFALPSSANDVDLADINEITNNFRKIDEKAVKKENVDQVYNPTSKNPQSGVAVAKAIFKTQEDIDTLNQGGLVLKEDFISQQIENWLDEHPEATTTVQDYSITTKKLHKDTVDWIRSGIVNVKDFDAKGDGVTDDTQAIKDAVATLKDGDTLYFPSGTYLVSFDMYISDLNNAKRKTIIHLYNKHNVTIDFGNSTLVLKAGGFNYAYMVEVSCCKNFTIKNGTLIGDKINHDYTVSSPNTGHELGYGIYVNSKDGVAGVPQNLPCYGNIDNCDISQFIGDAICTQNGTGTGKINIKNCYLHDCRRQGISILSSDEISVENTIIENIGVDEQAHDPKCGIDIEANSDTRTVNSLELQNVIIRKCGDISILKHNGTTLKRFIARNCQLANIGCDLGSTEEKMFKGDIYNSIIGLDRTSPDKRGVLVVPSTNFNLHNCTILDAVGVSIICTKMYNCRIIGAENYSPTTGISETLRILKVKEAYNCYFERIMLRENVNIEVPNADIDLGYFENCTFDTVHFIQLSLHEETRRNFLKCVFKNIQLADDKVSCKNLPQIFDMCIFDTKLKPNHILNNCICMDKPDTVETALDNIISMQNSYIGGA